MAKIYQGERFYKIEIAEPANEAVASSGPWKSYYFWVGSLDTLRGAEVEGKSNKEKAIAILDNWSGGSLSKFADYADVRLISVQKYVNRKGSRTTHYEQLVVEEFPLGDLRAAIEVS